MSAAGTVARRHSLRSTLRFYGGNLAADTGRELRFLLRAPERRAFSRRLAAAAGSPARLFAFAEAELGLYQREAELLAFLELAAARDPAAACEIGTWRGGTNLLLGELLPSLKLLVGIDRLVQNRRRLRRATRADLEHHLLQGDAGSARTRRRVETVLEGRRLDLLFIDGDHHYHAVKADFDHYRRLVADEGLIVFHDIVPDYRTRFGVRGGPWSGGVPQWWAEVRQRYRHWEIVEDATQNAFGIGLIEYRDEP